MKEMPNNHKDKEGGQFENIVRVYRFGLKMETYLGRKSISYKQVLIRNALQQKTFCQGHTTFIRWQKWYITFFYISSKSKKMHEQQL